MKNNRGFTTLTFVIFISALLSYFIITNSDADTLFLQELQSTQQFYEQYFNDLSAKNISFLINI